MRLWTSKQGGTRRRSTPVKIRHQTLRKSRRHLFVPSPPKIVPSPRKSTEDPSCDVQEPSERSLHTCGTSLESSMLWTDYPCELRSRSQRPTSKRTICGVRNALPSGTAISLAGTESLTWSADSFNWCRRASPRWRNGSTTPPNKTQPPSRAQWVFEFGTVFSRGLRLNVKSLEGEAYRKVVHERSRETAKA